MKVLARTVFVSLWLVLNVSFAETLEVGVCEAGKQREVQSVRYNVEARKDLDETFVAKRTCSDEAIVIKNCALIGVKNQKVQEFCFPEGRPAYYEYFDVVEYWEAVDTR